MTYFPKSLVCLLVCLLNNLGFAQDWLYQAYTVEQPIEFYYYAVVQDADDASQIDFYDLPDFLSVDSDSNRVVGTATQGGVYTFRIETLVDGELTSFYPTIYIADSIWSGTIATEDPISVFAESETTLLSIGWNGDVLRTTDGVNWIAAPAIPSMTAVRGAAYMSGTFVAMSGTGALAYSADNGDNWSLADLPDLEWMHLLQVLNGEFVVFSNVPNSDASLVFRSTDGIHWSSSTIDLGRVSACGYMGGKYYINTYPGGVSVSEDFSTWSSVQLDGTESARAFGQLSDGQLFMIGSQGEQWKSTDGISWLLVQTLNDWGETVIETTEGLYLASSITLQFTTNGTDWSLLEASESGWHDLFYSQRLDQFFASEYFGIRGSDGSWLPQITTPEAYAQETLLVDEYFEYQLQTSLPSTNYYAFNLPDGFNFNESTGLLYGTPAQSISYHEILFGAENANGFSPAKTLNLRISNTEGAPVTYQEFSAFEIDADLPQSMSIPLSGSYGSTTSQLDGLPESMNISNTRLNGSLSPGISTGTLTIENQYGTAPLPLTLVSSVRDWRSMSSVSAYFQTNINYGDGRFYAANRNASFFSSEDGIHWEESTAPWYLAAIDDLTGFDGYTYAISYLGSIYRSQTHSNWELVQDGWYGGVYNTSNWIRNVNGRLFASRIGGSEFRNLSILKTSSDGVNWTDLDFEVDDYFTDIVYEAGLYVLVGQEHVLTSVDGTTWVLKYDNAPGESLDYFNYSSSACAADGGFIITMGNNKAFYLDPSEPELQPITHDGFEVYAPWAVVNRGDSFYAQDTLGNELHSADGITWTMSSENPTTGWGGGEKNQALAAEGVELWNTHSKDHVQVYQPTNLPQLTNDEIIQAHVNDTISRSLDLSLNATVDLIEGLPNGLTYDAGQNLITGTFDTSGYFGATVQLSNENGMNFFLLRFEVLPALAVVTVVDSVVPVEEFGDAYFPLIVESSSDYQITWKEVSATYAFYYETVFEAPYDITRLQYPYTSAGSWHAKVTNAGGTVYSDPIELMIRQPYGHWDDDKLEGKSGKEIGWQQTNLERYALALNTEADKVHLPKLQSDGATQCFEFSLSQLAQDLNLGIEYSTDLVEWEGEEDLTIEQVSEDLERVHFKAYLTTPLDRAFYRLSIVEESGSNSGSGSSWSGSVYRWSSDP